MARSRYEQPWVRVQIGGKRCQVQVLDPETAFELEPKLVAVLGQQLSLVTAAPGYVANAVLESAAKADPIGGRALVQLMQVGRLLQSCLADLSIPPDFALHVAETLLIDRLEVGKRLVEDWDDFRRLLGRGPLVRWEAIAKGIAVTYGPLWTRKPYDLKEEGEGQDYGVPLPPGVSQVRMWCEQLAANGRATSANDVLRTWTPVEVIESVEALSYVAERERRHVRAQAAARAKPGQGARR